jgi:hypothetical protein
LSKPEQSTFSKTLDPKSHKTSLSLPSQNIESFVNKIHRKEKKCPTEIQSSRKLTPGNKDKERKISSLSQSVTLVPDKDTRKKFAKQRTSNF